MDLTATAAQEARQTRQSARAIWLKRSREWHLYLGTFFAPSIIFFTLTGAIQLFGLHEGHRGETYQPPAWVVQLGSIHKNQTLLQRRGPAPGVAEGRRPSQAGEGSKPRPVQARRSNENQTSKSALALKWFFLLMSLGLIVTTGLGIYMAFKFNRSRAVTWSLLLIGTAIPAALIALTA